MQRLFALVLASMLIGSASYAGPNAFEYQGLFTQMDGPTLGVQASEMTPELRDFFGAAGEVGVLVSRVLPDTAAERSGLRVGDVIVFLNDVPVGSVGDLRTAVATHAGQPADLIVMRNGKERTLRAEIEAAPPQPEREQAQIQIFHDGEMRTIELPFGGLSEGWTEYIEPLHEEHMIAEDNTFEHLESVTESLDGVHIRLDELNERLEDRLDALQDQLEALTEQQERLAPTDRGFQR